MREYVISQTQVDAYRTLLKALAGVKAEKDTLKTEGLCKLPHRGSYR